MFKKAILFTALLFCHTFAVYAQVGAPFTFPGGDSGDIQINDNGQFGGRTLVGGTNVSIGTDANTITIHSAGSDSVIHSGANIGDGEGEVFSEVAGTEFRFRTIAEGDNVTITTHGSSITISVDGDIGADDLGNHIATELLKAGFGIESSTITMNAGWIRLKNPPLATTTNIRAETQDNTGLHVSENHGVHVFHNGSLVAFLKETLVRFNRTLALQSHTTTVSSNQNNLHIGFAPVARLNVTATADITGFSRLEIAHTYIVTNVGTNPATLKHQSTGSTEVNRIITPDGEDYVLQPNESVNIWHDFTVSRWRILDKTWIAETPTDLDAYIQNRDTLQEGSTFYVDRGIINKTLEVNNQSTDGPETALYVKAGFFVDSEALSVELPGFGFSNRKVLTVYQNPMGTPFELAGITVSDTFDPIAGGLPGLHFGRATFANPSGNEGPNPPHDPVAFVMRRSSTGVTSRLRWSASGGSIGDPRYFNLTVPNVVSSSMTLVLPGTIPTVGQSVVVDSVSNGVINLSYDDVAGSSSSGTAAYGALSFRGNFDLQGTTTPTKMSFFDTNGVSNLTTPDHTNDHIVIDRDGVFSVFAVIKSTASVGGPTPTTYSIAVNDTPTMFTIESAGFFQEHAIGILSLSENDEVSLYLESAHNDGAVVSYTSLDLILTGVGGGIGE